MDAETYYIPANYTDAGKLFGLFEIRNAIEAVLVGLPVLDPARLLQGYEADAREGACGAASGVFAAGSALQSGKR